MLCPAGPLALKLCYVLRETDTQMHMVFHRYYGDGMWTCQSTAHLSGGRTVSVPFGPLAKEHISTALYFVNEDGFTSKSINVR
ncbi:unnamed protein product [Gadus morhua 'NCC']